MQILLVLSSDCTGEFQEKNGKLRVLQFLTEDKIKVASVTAPEKLLSPPVL